MRRLVLMISLLIPAAVSAQTPCPPPEDVVGLQAAAEREVANDLLQATLYAELEGADAAALAARVNRLTKAALDAARGVAGVKVESGAYQTFPVYGDQGTFKAWRVRHELSLESRDFAAASALIGRLQGQQMRLGGLQFTTAPETRRQAENALIQEAVHAFRQRAGVAQAALGKGSYRVREVQIQTEGGMPSPYPVMEMRASAKVADAPAFSPGESTVRVNVSGTVQME